ncbi:EF-hand domain-containing family member B-like [Spodoptera litura]|uniref:EF-hand domain-containing family member B-like n=1 Tax=Spodoptera litura TaxID=69820 RepID=A0A9J7IYJ2_SPOLT|nr:EF-hand domain-containing family member B-like [Spodoptera litura]
MLRNVPCIHGGKGNAGLFYERSPNIAAAGKPTAQHNESVAKHLQCYLLKDEVDALIGDAIIPITDIKLKPPKHKDMRHAGANSAGSELINPPSTSKYQDLVEDLKCTVYRSYWKSRVGAVADQTPMLPKGCKILTTTMGKKTKVEESLYDVILPKVPLPDLPDSKQPSYRTTRNYCSPAFDPNSCFGKKSNVGNLGRHTKCCLTDERVILGNSSCSHINSVLADFKHVKDAHLGLPSSPNRNIDNVPTDFTFGKLKPSSSISEVITTCPPNLGRLFYLKCLKHLNNVRRCLAKNLDSQFFHSFYLHLKYLDGTNSGWLSKETVYEFCMRKYIKIEPSLMEPLLESWNAFNGTQIKYKTFVRVINHTEPLPQLPKIPDISKECLYYSTTYEEMMKPGQKAPDKNTRAGLPAGRYFDRSFPVIPPRYCRAHTVFLSEETDAKACLCPSIFSVLGVSHRDMYAKRSAEVVRKVFEAAGESFTDQSFNELWEEAKLLHSEGWVSFATFRKVLDKNHVDAMYVNQ